MKTRSDEGAFAKIRPVDKERWHPRGTNYLVDYRNADYEWSIHSYWKTEADAQRMADSIIREEGETKV